MCLLSVPGPKQPLPANVVVVAKNGGDFTSIQAALDSIGDAAVDNRYLVRIGPGIFSEQVTTQDYVVFGGFSSAMRMMPPCTSPPSRCRAAGAESQGGQVEGKRV